MLKIKDNVDLKELEKFGLEPFYECDSRTGITYLKFLISEKYEGKYGYCIFGLKNKKKKGLHILCGRNKIISNDNKYLSLYAFQDNTYVDVDLLYDLIKADMVEKV